MRLDEAIQLHLDTLKPSTAKTYWSALKSCVEVIGAGREIEDIVTADLVRVHNQLLKKNYTPATLRQRVTSIKIFFKWLHDMDLAEENPARVLKVKRLKRPLTREKVGRSCLLVSQ